MSVGSKKVVVRLGDALLSRIHTEVWQRNITRGGGTYNLSDFIRSAVCEKLKHLARGRKSRTERKFREEKEMADNDEAVDEVIPEYEAND